MRGCYPWPVSHGYGCSGGEWKQLNTAMTLRDSSSCKKLCLGQHENGCCFLKDGEGCKWMSGGSAAFAWSDSIAISCRAGKNKIIIVVNHLMEKYICIRLKEHIKRCLFDSDYDYIHVFHQYPQNKNVAEYCPGGTENYLRHVCGAGAVVWRGNETVQYGPFQTNNYLSSSGDDIHCLAYCSCNSITVECKQSNTKKLVELDK